MATLAEHLALPQQWGEVRVIRSDALVMLRAQCRKLCGLPLIPPEQEITNFEISGVFAISYVHYNGSEMSREIRFARCIQDYHDYITCKAGLPHYVMSAYCADLPQSSIPKQILEFFRLVSLSDHPIASPYQQFANKEGEFDELTGVRA